MAAGWCHTKWPGKHSNMQPPGSYWHMTHESAPPFAGDGCSIVSVSYGAQGMHEHSLIKIVCAWLAPQGLGGFSSDANWGFFPGRG